VTDEQKSPVDQALDLMLFGPLGLAITAREELPRMIEKGRSRVMLARMIGEHATRHGQRVVSRAVQHSARTLVDLGILPAAPQRPAGRPPVDDGEPGEAPAAGAVRTDPVAATGSAGHGRARTADLAIPGYDSLSASQVVQRLAGLAPAELEAVRTYEAAGRGRRTILNRIAQLQSGRP